MKSNCPTKGCTGEVVKVGLCDFADAGEDGYESYRYTCNECLCDFIGIEKVEKEEGKEE